MYCAGGWGGKAVGYKGQSPECEVFVSTFNDDVPPTVLSLGRACPSVVNNKYTDNEQEVTPGRKSPVPETETP